jgi:hypothetical protein
MGIVGFTLMLMTETLYTLRKRSHSARWGKMASWLQFHIFTGLVGPYLVLLHSAWKFGGLAGIVMILTLVVVASGFIGRYIYTAIPRSLSGEELSLDELADLVRQTETSLTRMQAGKAGQGENDQAQLLNGSAPVEGKAGLAGRGIRLVWSRAWIDLRETVEAWQASRNPDKATRERVKALTQLRQRRNRLQRQMASLSAARNMLSIWHALHIPIGLSLFVMAFLHIFAAIYFGSILR